MLICFSNVFAQRPSFEANQQPSAPDCSDEKNWSALPFRNDAADAIPKSETWVSDSLKDVDVFYIHPTLYLKGKTWNADVNDKKLNKKVDEKPIHYQASVFNETCRVYAPRYRQSVVDVFYENKSTPDDSRQSLEFAYFDVRRAFEFYLSNYNKGRPIIIASHSQGSYHAIRLLQEYFDTTNLMKQLVAAYVVGMGINENMFENLKVCGSGNQTACFAGWISYKYGHVPTNKFFLLSQCVNPVTWTRDSMEVDRSQSMGTIVLNLNKKRANACTTQLQQKGTVLWVKTKAPLLRYFKNLHIADYNLFWYDIRKNVKDRISAFWKS